tara:strand:- start:1425 stop:3065 length:1641 start_codon:yes stop_codon:yes gene_type:complete
MKRPKVVFEQPTSPEAWADLKSRYEGARANRFRRSRADINTGGASADWHYKSAVDYLRDMEYARDMVRNDSIIGQTINRLRDNIIQDGFTLEPETGSDSLNEYLKGRWKEYSTDPDKVEIQGEFTFWDLEALAFKQSLVDGDIIVVGREEGSLQFFEAHRARTPRSTVKNVVQGFLLDENRKRKEVWITKEDISPLHSISRVNETESIPIFDNKGHRQVFHIFDPGRTTQTRGVSALVPIFDVSGMFEDINFFKLVQQNIVSCMGMVHEFELGAPKSGGEGSFGEEVATTTDDGNTRIVEGISPGQHYFGEPGETLKEFSPNVPNPEFFPHVNLMLTIIGVNLGLPMVTMLMDAKETNFSGWRGAISEARLGFRRTQLWLINKFHRPVYRWKIRKWIEQGDRTLRSALTANKVDVFAHAWNPQRWKYIQPRDDATADLIRIRNGLTSPRRRSREQGDGDWHDLSTEIVQDHALGIRKAKKEAQKINSEYPDDPDPVHWQQLYTVPTPDGVQLNLIDEPSNPEPEEKPETPRGRLTNLDRSGGNGSP